MSEFKQKPTENGQPPHSCPFHFNSEQLYAFQKAMIGENTFITGSAGTGKSMVVRHLVQALYKKYGKEKVALTAPTGSAARNIGGVTLHNLLRLGKVNQHESGIELAKRILIKDPKGASWQTPKVLIIDEVSLISGELWTKLDLIARGIRNNFDAAWGGLQIIAVGDFFQLRPIASSGAARPTFAFESKMWKAANFVNCELTKIYRQKDSKFVHYLGLLRKGCWNKDVLNYLRELHRPNRSEDSKVTYIMSRNDDVNRINN